MIPAPISTVVLAGGLARRFRGDDKGLITLARRPLAAWVTQRLAADTREMMISANRNLALYAALGHPVVCDYLPGNPGPLAGMLAAGRAARQEWLLGVPCDLPFLPLDLGSRMLAQAQADGHSLVRAADETGVHFAVMLMHRSLLADLEEYVTAGGRQVRAWQEAKVSGTVEFSGDPYAFLNVNTQEDLRQAERLAPRYLC